MFATLFYFLRIGFATTSSIKSGIETVLWTKRVSTELWKMSAFKRKKKEAMEKIITK